MKFCYVDESGTGDQPVAVMAGVIIDAYRMRPTKNDWVELLSHLADIVGREVEEFHTRDFYAGNGPWRGLRGEERKAVVTEVFAWYAARRHQIVYSVIHKRKYDALGDGHEFRDSIGSIWTTLGLHVTLALQKEHQTKPNNKGNTVLVFDNHDRDQTRFTELLLDPPAWTDTFYRRNVKKRRLDQIVDVPHFVDSKHVGLIQLADCIAYFLRRHIEIVEGLVPEAYEGEASIVGRWADAAFAQAISTSSMYPRRRRCDAAEFFYGLAPNSVAG